MEKLFTSAGEGCDLIDIGDMRFSVAIKIGFNLNFDGFTAKVIRHEFLINSPIFQVVIITRTAEAEQRSGVAVNRLLNFKLSLSKQSILSNESKSKLGMDIVYIVFIGLPCAADGAFVIFKNKYMSNNSTSVRDLMY